MSSFFTSVTMGCDGFKPQTAPKSVQKGEDEIFKMSNSERNSE